MIWPLTLLPRWNGHPKPSDHRFDGLTVLITATNSGLGLEAAKKLAALGTSTLIVTARNEEKGRAAKAAIEAHLRDHGIEPSCKIVPMTLEMSDPASIQGFVAALGNVTGHLDHVILNAGMINSTYQQLPTGYEPTVQINAISTILLSLLLLPSLKASPLVKQSSVALRPHLTYISSYAAWLTDVSTKPGIASAARPLAHMSQQENFPVSMVAGFVQYGRTKLMLEHAFRRVAFLPFVADPDEPSLPAILLTSVEPGPTSTDIFRDYKSSWLASIASYVISFVGRSPEQAANSYVTSLHTGLEARGEMWMDDQVLTGKPVKDAKSEEGLKVGQRVWEEMKEIVRGTGDESGVLAKVLDL